MNVVEMLDKTALRIEINPHYQSATASNRSFDWRPGGTSGIMLHHTVSPANSGNMPSRNVVVNGRTNLSGPLSHFLIGRDGKVLLVSQNYCHHAGRGRKDVLDNCKDDILPPDHGEGAYDARHSDMPETYRGGNGDFWGVEVENDGINEPYPKIQIVALTELLAAICQWQRWHPLTRIIHHREWTSRKIDMSYRKPIREMVKSFSNLMQQIGANPVAEPPLLGANEFLGLDNEMFEEGSRQIKALKRGDNGRATYIMQGQMLLLMDPDSLARGDFLLDGIFGNKTEKFVMDFQELRGLYVDGICGPKTWKALLP